MSNDQPQDRTRGQRASLATPPQESPPERYVHPRADFPLSHARVLPFTDGPMAPALAAIEAAALEHAARGRAERPETLRALGVAIVRVEMTLPYAADAEDAPAEGAAAPRPSCSKIPIVELLFDEAQRVDRGNLRLLLRYVGDLSARFQDELDAKDREAADSAAEGEAESGGVMGSRGPRATSGTSRRWKEPEPVPMKENFPGLD
ncbi:uncharacterized protein L3040_001675 [Drepanopeziza brunnea f. sp. 'multigermtubi']|uniref:uncharacterized protein n=1 Tax=Drepanopeziza brunnea f. sp. 'multigermtubi' TaxID=698441 RepID=UPI0023869FAA|nr:hypothetical protein L3040_001675 [Drepanopeziza brunnea f. sp. 'multigermtubi']